MRRNPSGASPNRPWENLPFLGAVNRGHFSGTGHLAPSLWHSAAWEVQEVYLGPFGNQRVQAHGRCGKICGLEGKGGRVSDGDCGRKQQANRDPFTKDQVSRPGPSSLPTLAPPTLPRTHFFTRAPSVHPSGVIIGCPWSVGH